jgi:hypothetical protein
MQSVSNRSRTSWRLHRSPVGADSDLRPVLSLDCRGPRNHVQQVELQPGTLPDIRVPADKLHVRWLRSPKIGIVCGNGLTGVNVRFSSSSGSEARGDSYLGILLDVVNNLDYKPQARKLVPTTMSMTTTTTAASRTHARRTVRRPLP